LAERRFWGNNLVSDWNQPWVCTCCGELHSELAISFAADFPDLYVDLSADERTSRGECSSDQCFIDDDFFAVRGMIEIPIRGTEQNFLWGAWARVSLEDFVEIQESWEEEGREEKRGPFKGRLANKLPPYDALNLKLTVKIQPTGTRPLFYIDEPHLLTAHQRDGISLDEARTLSATLMHAFDSTLPVN
jgi:hypothetical protein